MLLSIIDFSLRNRLLVLAATAALAAAGLYSLKKIPLDAIPDLSDTQVILYTQWDGQSPKIIQDQITYPLSSKMLSVPGAKTVRAYSFYGFSLVHVLFEDGTDPYWARSRVLEYLAAIRSSLPPNVSPSLGPDATGVGWAFMYALNSPNHDLAELRSIQDWFLRNRLASVPGVAEIASVGGFVRQYQIALDPLRLQALNLSVNDVADAVRRSNSETGARSIELAETELVLRVKGFVSGPGDLRQIAVGPAPGGTPVLLGEIADIRSAPAMRRGIAEWNGEGETVAGIVVVRQGADTRQVVADVKDRLADAAKSLPEGVTVSVAYDRSALIGRAVATLETKLAEECLVVALVCLFFLLHLRSALVACVVLPTAVLASFALMSAQGLGANIMSLGGIAIAIGAMVDAVIIMIENAHKRLEHDAGRRPRLDVIRDAAVEVGPALFCSLLVITVSFLPVFTLQAQEGRMFRPLAFTKTYAMAAAALLSITLAPVLMGLFIRGKIPREESNPLNRLLVRLYQPLLAAALRFPKSIILAAALAVAWVFLPWNAAVRRLLPDGPAQTAALRLGSAFPWQSLGSEFMPPLNEGDLLYMPTTFPGISPTKARELLQQTDRAIKAFPEVDRVLGKIGRADSATDPAPLDMLETTILLKPRDDWPAVDFTDPASGATTRRRRTHDELVSALNAAVRFPGLSNAWTMPVKARTDMLATGIKTPVGVKVAGPDLREIERVAAEIETVLRRVHGAESVFAERVMGGTALEITPDRAAIARHGLRVADVQDLLASALGGIPVSTAFEGLERYDIIVRLLRDYRENIEAIAEIPVPVKTTPPGAPPAHVPLSHLASVRVVPSPMSVKSEGGVPNAWVYADVRGVDTGSFVRDAQAAVAAAVQNGEINIPDGCTVSWSGEFEHMLRANARLKVVVPLTLLLIVFILYLNTRSWARTAIVLLAVPFSLVGAVGALWLCGYHLSAAVWVGLIALAGLDAETGVVMLLYLDLARSDWKQKGLLNSASALRDAIRHGAARRLRPKIMTAAVIIAGLLPILWSDGAGADTMKRVALPMVGGVVTSTFLELLVYPAIYLLWRKRADRLPNTP
ncbi:MAG: efflux RND transporter permease subunit [Opitutaceae bacterium]|jgi:Cu(I)/Ag(I) efflux system membrane protein CusA/SilA|nr:efflux RND transporter permease subunit [Opitutaceae bacterium]